VWSVGEGQFLAIRYPLNANKERRKIMSITVRIPTPLQSLTKNQNEVQASAASVKEIIADLELKFPGIKARICDESGKVRRFVNIYVNEEDIRFLKGEETFLKDGDEVSIIPAIAGG
jgi:molybdopterin synthase sulfur carrier subunit